MSMRGSYFKPAKRVAASASALLHISDVNTFDETHHARHGTSVARPFRRRSTGSAYQSITVIRP